MDPTLWSRVLTHLETALPPQILDTWVRPCHLATQRDNHVEIAVPNRFIRRYLEEHYLDVLQQAVIACAGPRTRLVLTLDRHPERSPVPPPAPLVLPAQVASTPDLDARYTFDTFVVGNSNQFAQAACIAVAEQPARAYNPLFLYGGVGLGKTHLLHAIGHHAIRAHPQLRVLYLSMEKFTNELISAIRYDRTADFRRRYRTIDLLLIDDIQFIAGKERTQEEFFHTFNDLKDAKGQIAISSDRAPREIPDIEERLRSRFQSGLIADISPPDLETRVAILKKKAESDGLPLPDDVAFFIANRVKSNIRELEGSLTRIRAFCSLTGRSLSLDLAQEVLASIWGHDQRPITIDEIQRRVSEVFGVKPQDLRAKTRTKAVALPRQVAMFLARQLTSESYADIGRGFGGKDHTTVMHAVQKIQAVAHHDPKFQKTLDHIISTLRLE